MSPLPIPTIRAPRAPQSPQSADATSEDRMIAQEHLLFFREHLAALTARRRALTGQLQALHTQVLAVPPASGQWGELRAAARVVRAERQHVGQAWNACWQEYRHFAHSHLPR